MKIWFQGATDRALMSPYIAKVEAHFKAVLEADTTFSFNTTTPPATTTHALTEYRVGRSFIKSAIQAEKEGYDVVAVTHFQDLGCRRPSRRWGFPCSGSAKPRFISRSRSAARSAWSPSTRHSFPGMRTRSSSTACSSASSAYER